MDSQKIVVFCLTGSNFSGKFLDSFTDVLIYCMHSNIKFVVSRHESAVVYFVRNMCLGGDVLRGKYQKPFNGQINYTHLMWIDSDIVFTSQQFQKLFEHDKDIVSGVYRMADQKFLATVKDWNEETFMKQGCFDFLVAEDYKNKTGLMEVAYTGLGFMLVKKGVFEAITYPWFEPIFFAIGEARDFTSEDVSFCRKVSRKGFKIYIDPQIRVGHEKKIVL